MDEMQQSVSEKIRWAFIFWLARRLPDCRAMTPVLGESLDRKLSIREKIVVRLHLFTCAACANYLKQIKFISDAIHDHGEEFARSQALSEARLSIEARERFKQLLRTSDGPAR